MVICKEIQGRDRSYTFSVHANSSEFCSIHFACLRKLRSLAPKSPNKPGGEWSWMHQASTRKLCEWKWFSIVDALQLQSLRSHIWIPHYPVPRSEGKIPDQRLFADPFEISKCHQFIPLWLGASCTNWKSWDREGTRGPLVRKPKLYSLILDHCCILQIHSGTPFLSVGRLTSIKNMPVRWKRLPWRTLAGFGS